MGGPGSASAATAVPAPSTSSPDEPPIIGKRELLLWIHDVLGDAAEGVDFSTLRLGHVFLRLFRLIWPDVVKAMPNAGNLHPQTPDDVAANWEAIEWTLQRVGVPLSFVNRSLIRTGNFEACYQSLVFLFFLYCLARDHECEFVLAHSVDPDLTEFMSSEAPLACLVSGGAVDVPPPIKERIMTPRAPLRNEGKSSEDAVEGDLRSKEGQGFAGEVVRCPDHGPQQRMHSASSCQLAADSSQGREAPRRGTSSHLPAGQNEASSAATQQTPPSQERTQTRVVGGAFTSDGTFRLEQCEGSLTVGATEKQTGSKCSDAAVQTEAPSHREVQEWPLLLPHAPLDWCGEGQKVRGEQLIEMLRYQNDLLKQQLERAADEASAMRRHHEQQTRDLREAAAIELQRVKEKSNADLLDQQAKHTSAIQALRHQLDMRIRQIEDDVTIDIEVLCSSSTLGCLANTTREDQREGETNFSAQEPPGHEAALSKVKKLQGLMEERLRARDATTSEVKQLLQTTLQQCAAYRRDSDNRWNQWKRCEGLKGSLLQLVSKTGHSSQTSDGCDYLSTARRDLNEEVQRLLEQSGFPIPSISVLEQKLLAALVESLCLQYAEHARHRQEEIELTRRIHQSQQSHEGLAAKNGSISAMQNELLLEEQVRRLDAQNQRLLRTTEYLRLKVEHLEKWRAQDSAFSQQTREARQNGTTAVCPGSAGPATQKEGTEDVEDIDADGGETSVAETFLHAFSDTTDRDAELLHLLKSLGRPSKAAFGDETEAGQSSSLTSTECEELRPRGSNNDDEIGLSAATRKKLLQLFWLFLGDFYKYKARLEEGSHQLRYMQRLVRTVTKQRISTEQDAEQKRIELVCSFEKRIQQERCAFQKALGRTLVKLLVAQEQVEFMQKLKNKQEDDHEALLQVLHQADTKRFNVILGKLHSVETTNRILQKREQFWNQLAKALSMQLNNPSDTTQRAIQDLWSQLMGSKVLIASDVLELSADSLSLQLRDAAKPPKKGDTTPRSPCERSTVSSNAKQTSRPCSRLNSKNNSNIGPAPKTAGKPHCASPVLRKETPAAALEQRSTRTSDSWGSADSFAKCLKEICCQQSFKGDQKTPVGLDSSGLGSSFEVMQPLSDSDDDSSSSIAGLVSDQLLLWQEQVSTESETSRMPKDWVTLLKVMAQEATALFKKHKALKDKEVDELKKERETHLDKCKKLMLQLSDQQTLCTSLREQHYFFQQQHQLALESLKRVQQEKAKLELAQRDIETELRLESAELRSGQEEMRKVLSALASQPVDAPYIAAVFTSHVGVSLQSQNKITANPLLGTPDDVTVPPKAGEPKCSVAADSSLPTCRAEISPCREQAPKGSDAKRRASASSCHGGETPDSRNVVPVAAVKQHKENWKAPAAMENLKSTCPTGTPASTDDALECEAEHDRDSNCGTPASKDIKNEDERNLEKNGVDFARTHRGGRSELCTATSNHADASVLQTKMKTCVWEEEMSHIPSTTAPTPRSPPRAALAPLISPTRLMRALRMHARTPTGDPESAQLRQQSSDKKGCTKEKTSTSAERPCAYQPQPASAHKWTTTNCKGSRVQSTDQHSIVGGGSFKLATADAMDACALEHHMAKVASPGAGILAEETSNKFSAETDRTQRTSCRAAAEQAWEDFVEDYGRFKEKRHASTLKGESVRGWESARMPCIHRSNGSVQGSGLYTCDLPEETGSVMQGVDSGTRTDENDTRLTTETTDSALQDVLNIEQDLKEDELGSFCANKVGEGNLLSAEDVFISDDTNRLGISATAFLRRLGSQLESRMRVSSNRQAHIN